MDFAFDARTEELRDRLLAFMDEHVYPAEPVADEQRAALASPWDTPQVVEDLKAEARKQGLWNLFLPDDEYGAGLTNLQYAPLAEITGRSPQLAPTALNCAARTPGTWRCWRSSARRNRRSSGCGRCWRARSGRRSR